MAGQTRTGHAKGVADGDRAAVDIEAFQRNAQLALAVQGLRGKGLVQLPEINVLHRQSVARQQLGHGKHRANAHLIGLATGNRQAAEGAQRREAQLGGFLGFHQHAGGRTIGQLRGIAGGDKVARALDGLQLGQAFERGRGAVAVVHGGGHILVADLTGFLVLLGHARGAGHDLVVEGAIGLGRCRALLTLQREGILVFAVDAVALGHHIGRVDHGHEEVRLVFQQPGVGIGGVGVARTDQRDALDAAGHHGGRAVDNDAAGRKGNGLQARGAKTVDHGAAHADGQAGAHGRLAADIAAGGAFGVAAAQHHVFDQGRVNAGALHRSADGKGGQLRARRDIELPTVGFGQRRTRCRNDDGFTHACLLGSERPLIVIFCAASTCHTSANSYFLCSNPGFGYVKAPGCAAGLDGPGWQDRSQAALFRLSKFSPFSTSSTKRGEGVQNSASSLANSRMSARTLSRPTMSAHFIGPPRKRGKP